MLAALILRFARTRRWAIVGSVTRKARAISGVARPPRVRSVSATRASGARAGWQQVKISRRRSSGITGASSGLSSSAAGGGPSARSSSCFSLPRRSRRRRSIALFRAVVVIQAPGLSGMPRSGHTFIATTNASWTASSARSKSPSTRISEAVARPDSCRNRRSTSSGEASLGSRFLDQVPGFVEDHHRADLDRPELGARDLRRPFDRLVEVLAVEHVEAAQLLLGLGEGPVGDLALAVAHAHGGRGLSGVEALAGDQHALLLHLLGDSPVCLAHGLLVLLARGCPLALVSVDRECVLHLSLLLSGGVVRRFTLTTNRGGPDRQMVHCSDIDSRGWLKPRERRSSSSRRAPSGRPTTASESGRCCGVTATGSSSSSRSPSPGPWRRRASRSA